MPFIFDYDIFYKYYTHPSNFYTDGVFPRPIVWYYPDDVHPNIRGTPVSVSVSNEYIQVNGKQIYTLMYRLNGNTSICPIHSCSLPSVDVPSILIRIYQVSWSW